MKKIFLALLAFFISIQLINAAEEGTQIKLKIKGLENKTCYLAGYYGNKQYYKDTAVTDEQGRCIFKKEASFPGGVYSVVENNRLLFEIVVNEPLIDLETDTLEYIKRMKVNVSEENKLFYDHLLFINSQQSKLKPLQERLKDEKLKKKEKEEIQNKIQEIGEATKSYRLNIVKSHPKTLVAKMFATMKEPNIPDFLEEKNDSVRKVLKYTHRKEHFMDDVDFADERLIRTPLYHNKIEKFLNSIVYPSPDSIIVEVDRLVDKARANSELYKYTVHYVTTTYERSKIMGMDAVFSHVGLKYYTHKDAFWLDSTQIEKIREKAAKIKPLLIGKTAINLNLLDTSGKKWESMADIKKDYTVLIFWDPECGHCKTELPKVARYYDSIKDKSVGVYAVSSDHNKAWKKFIRENDLHFTNVAVPKEVYEDQSLASEYIIKGYTDIKSLNYHSTYDVYSTPQIYLLDKNKTIIGKKLDAELLEKILTKEFGES